MGESRKRCGLRDAQLRRRCAEIERARSGDADRALTQLHSVQVLLDDLLFAQVTLETQCPHRLRYLARPAPLGGMEQARELHRDRGSAGDGLTCANVRAQCAADRERVESSVIPEAFVLD